jgi:hypothetical protein
MRLRASAGKISAYWRHSELAPGMGARELRLGRVHAALETKLA